MLWITLLTLASSIQPPAPATAPYRQPQIAIAGKQVAMVFGGGSSVYFTSSSDNGATFAAPVKVAETGALALGRHRGPRVAILRDGTLVVSAIAGEKVATGPHAHGLPEAGNLLTWRSTDHGKTWTRSATINDVPGAAREGLHAMTLAADGKTLHSVWLDLRDKGTKLYGSKSDDGGKTWAKNTLVYESPDGTICQCCHPSLTADTRGNIWMMWRNVIGGNRDMYVLNTSAAKPEAVKQGIGTWPLNACPMDGGAFAVDPDGKVSSAWRRDGAVFLAERGAAEVELGKGKDVAMARNKRGSFVAWTKDGNVPVVRLPEGGVKTLGTGAAGGFVAMAAIDGRRVLAAWESQGSIETTILE
ncbi:hypothetical protein F183_A03340 [Bryobacterales bacterium F-183]|nr:hypothetical protein F183_A03340 [Bryobacterales bacterium F-183]